VSFLKHLTRLTFAIAALAVLAPATASAAPCWNQLLNDWYDGRIDKTYKVDCYKQALKHLPTDIQVYSSARDDIQRALASAVAQAAKDHVKNVDQLDVKPTSAGPTTTAQTTTASVETTPADTTTTDESATPPPPGRDNNDNGPFGVALAKGSDSPDSVPLPLIVLGVLALLLIAGGAAGLIARRMQTRGGPAA
jgi:hypothetical protein